MAQQLDIQTFFFASGLLLIILSCALFDNWLPILAVFIYLLAPLPNSICARCSRSDDLFYGNETNGWKDAGYFITSFFIVSGISLPIVFVRASLIDYDAGMMSIFGGLMVYGAIATFNLFE